MFLKSWFRHLFETKPLLPILATAPTVIIPHDDHRRVGIIVQCEDQPDSSDEVSILLRRVNPASNKLEIPKRHLWLGESVLHGVLHTLRANCGLYADKEDIEPLTVYTDLEQASENGNGNIEPGSLAIYSTSATGQLGMYSHAFRNTLFCLPLSDVRKLIDMGANSYLVQEDIPILRDFCEKFPD